VPNVVKKGALTYRIPQGPAQATSGTALPLLTYLYIYYVLMHRNFSSTDRKAVDMLLLAPRAESDHVMESSLVSEFVFWFECLVEAE
jgi:hypothetical protein